MISKSTQRIMYGLLLSASCTVSCAQVDPRPDFDRARSLVQESTGRQEVFDPYEPRLTEEALDAIIAGGLSLDEALRLALINNRELQAEFQDIGIAHAGWVQSKLLSNPSLDVLLRFPSGGGRSMLEASVGMELLELWRIPVRAEAARQDLEATVLRIARRAGERLAETRNSYYAAVAAEDLYQVASENVDLTTRSYDAVKSLHEAGAADAIDENLARGPMLAAELTVRTTRIAAANAKRELAKLLSIERSVETLALIDALPDPGTTAIDSEALVHQALRSRLDLRAIDTVVEALDARVHVERRKAWGDGGAGVSYERPGVSGSGLLGPALSLSLPLFDQNQAQVSRAMFELGQMLHLRESARVAVSQNVRSSADRVNTASTNLAFYNGEILPQAERSLALARESMASGRISLLALVEAQRQLLEARRSHVMLRLEAAISASDLERVVGGPLVHDS